MSLNFKVLEVTPNTTTQTFPMYIGEGPIDYRERIKLAARDFCITENYNLIAYRYIKEEYHREYFYIITPDCYDYTYYFRVIDDIGSFSDLESAKLVYEVL